MPGLGAAGWWLGSFTGQHVNTAAWSPPELHIVGSTRHTCTLGQSIEYWNCRILDKRCCGKCWTDPPKLPNYPEWWLGPVAGAGAQCAGLRAECGSEGEIQPGLAGWPGRGTGSGVYIHCRSLFRLHLHRLAAPPTTNHHWRQSCLNKTRIS